MSSLPRVTSSRPSRHRRSTPRAGTATHPIAPSAHGLAPNTGVLASAAWLAARGLVPSERRWHVDIVLDTRNGPAPADDDETTATRFQLEIYAEEWGFRFAHAGRRSWIRITDVPFVHGADEHDLLRQTPPLAKIESLIRRLEQRYGFRLDRRGATVRTNIADGEPVVARWLATL